MIKYSTMMFISHVYLWCMFPVYIDGYYADEPGFNLLFTTNTDEIQDQPIFFNKPLPPWLRGSLVRNGLGRFEYSKRSFTHSFDAYGKLCSWKFPGNGTAFFTTKFLKSKFYIDSSNTNDIAPYTIFGAVVPEFSELQKFVALSRGVDNMNVNILRFYNESNGKFDYVTVSDIWKIYVVDPLSLTTKRSVTANIPKGHQYTGSVKLYTTLSTAHPLPEPGTKYHITYVSEVSLIPGLKNKMILVKIKSAEEREAIAEWEVDRVSYMHSFSVTSNYAVFFAIPYFISISKMIWYMDTFEGLEWFSDRPTLVYVVDLRNGEIETLKTENMFFLHHVNAFEIGTSKLIVDIATYHSPEFLKVFEMTTLMDPVKRNKFDAHAHLKRYHIDLNANQILVQSFTPPKHIPFATYIDMVTINEHYRFRNNCFVYGAVLNKDNIKFSQIALIKKDLCGRNRDAYWYLPAHYPTESWFVPSPSSSIEDDGILITPILDGQKKMSYLAILDAKTMNLTHKAYLPTTIPLSFHGRFFEDLY
ncbi:hypothetical protein KUTeg_018695 [Tegillarca granosa]|uniref:Uncharacterized protein n=1 Tax=Tegillarca granosa TaxID=220873 RepID=A0ABQ9EEP7_TEGGR|nr:hypothetical protein KUTeg_018695 [Tegillarca granosa]